MWIYRATHRGKRMFAAIAVISHLLEVLVSYAKDVAILFQGFSPLLFEKEKGPKILAWFPVYSLERVLLHFGGKVTQTCTQHGRNSRKTVNTATSQQRHFVTWLIKQLFFHPHLCIRPTPVIDVIIPKQMHLKYQVCSCRLSRRFN